MTTGKTPSVVKKINPSSSIAEHLSLEPLGFISLWGSSAHPDVAPTPLIFVFSPFAAAENRAMRTAWQGKAGRSPLQALYESDQVRGWGEGGGVKGEWDDDPFFHPSKMCGTSQLSVPHQNLQLCPEEKTTLFWGGNC